MDALLNFVAFIIEPLIGLIEILILAYVIVSWLTAFDVINMRNRYAYSAARFLDSAVNPMLRPFRRLLPSLGGLDFSPVIVLLVLEGIRRILLPALFAWLHSLVGGSYPG